MMFEGSVLPPPVVYFSKRTAERTCERCTIAGESVELKTRGGVRSEGVIRASRDTTIGADTLINTGALHADERLELTAEGGDRARLEAVACAEVACWSGSDLGVTSRHVKEQVDGVVGAMRSDEYRSALAQLKRAAPGAFEYTWGDGVRDDWQDNNITTRMTGVAQWLGGGLQAAGAALTAPVTCRTSVSCHVAGYLCVGGLDASHAGARMTISGQPQSTWGGQAFGYLGSSPDAAELTYGLTQLSPVAYEAYAANKSANAWVIANRSARSTYATRSRGVAAATTDAEAGTSTSSFNTTNTGRPFPRNFKEKLALDEVKADPKEGRVLDRVPMTDPRWPGSAGWVKRANNVNGIEIHYVRDEITGAVDDFKFKEMKNVGTLRNE